MKVLVTGAAGDLGECILQELSRHRVECMGVNADELDILNPDNVKSCILSYAPDVVIHCGGYEDVDKAEEEVRCAAMMNGCGTVNIANACRDAGAKLAYISSGMVFPGNGSEPIRVDDMRAPVNVYGLGKLQAEKYITATLRRYFIIRTTWVYGTSGNDFVGEMLKQAKEEKEIQACDDQFSSPTYAADLARVVCSIVFTERYGIYHATGTGGCSLYQFACALANMMELRCDVVPVSTASRNYPARRPLNMQLDNSSLETAGFPLLPDWQTSLNNYLTDRVRLYY